MAKSLTILHVSSEASVIVVISGQLKPAVLECHLLALLTSLIAALDQWHGSLKICVVSKP